MTKPPTAVRDQTTIRGFGRQEISIIAAWTRQALAVLLALILAAPGMAAGSRADKKASDPGGSRLEGVVNGANGKPLKGAVISVRSLDGATAGSSQPSDRKGRFKVTGLHYGWADLVVTTPQGEFLGDQAINLPPGTKVIVQFDLLETADKPESWWKDRRVEAPAGIDLKQVTGMAQSSQRLTGVEYWKSPGGIAILVSVTVVALGFIASGGRNSNP